MNDWVYYWGESHSMISVSGWASNYILNRSIIGNEKTEKLIVAENRHVSCYVKGREIKNSEEYGKSYLDPKFLKLFLNESKRARGRFFDLYKIKGKIDLKRASNFLLMSLFSAYLRCFSEITGHFYSSHQEYLAIGEKRLKAILRTKCKGKNEVGLWFSLLSMPTNLDIIKREELDFISLVSKKTAEPAILEHAKKHSWLFYHTYEREAIRDFLEVKKQNTSGITVSQRKREIRKEIDIIKAKQKAIFSKFSNNPELIYLSSLFSQLSHDRLELKAVWSGAEYRFLDLFEEISQRIGIDINSFMWTYSKEDVEAFLIRGNRLSDDEISKRKKFYILVLNRGVLNFKSGDEAKIIAFEMVGYGSHEESDEIKGTIANPGKVSGKARVIFLKDIGNLMKDLSEFKKGEIMVTTMTQPTMVIIVKKASAIVADEGGLTSHAAVLSREFGIPCIVGCRNATTLIKTGDMIEVDANRGIVRKLSK